MIRHPESVKCLHLHGWDLYRWCASYFRNWEQFEAEPGQDREAAFRRYCDVIVAYAVLEELESERIAAPTFGEIVERLRPLPSLSRRVTSRHRGRDICVDAAIGWPHAGP